jgi:hypothetical protein
MLLGLRFMDQAYNERSLGDEIGESRETATAVMPAKAGIQEYQPVTKHWTPAFAGVTTFLRRQLR